jgi:protein-S-isoprenylcysteine O-methyltransferase Ste14
MFDPRLPWWWDGPAPDAWPPPTVEDEDRTMLRALGVFLVGALILAVVLYVAHLVIGLLTLPPAIAQLALIIIGLLGLIALIYLAVYAFRNTPGGPSIL